MSTFNLVESPFDPKTAVYNAVVDAGDPWIHEIKKGQVFRILDLEGNQAVDTLFFNARDPEERYSSADTVRAQGALYLTAGTQLMSTEGNVMLTAWKAGRPSADDVCRNSCAENQRGFYQTEILYR